MPVERGNVARVAQAYSKFLVGIGPLPNPSTQKAAPITAEALASQPTAIVTVSIQCDTGAQESIFVGNEFGQFREVAAGNTLVLRVLDLQTVYVRSATGNGTYNYIAYLEW